MPHRQIRQVRFRRLMYGELPYGIQPGFDGAPPARCQFIAGRPSTDDACKCNRPTRPGSSYCAPHHALCWYPAEEEDAVDGAGV